MRRHNKSKKCSYTITTLVPSFFCENVTLSCSWGRNSGRFVRVVGEKGSFTGRLMSFTEIHGTTSTKRKRTRQSRTWLNLILDRSSQSHRPSWTSTTWRGSTVRVPLRTRTKDGVLMVCVHTQSKRKGSKGRGDPIPFLGSGSRTGVSGVSGHITRLDSFLP